MFRHIAAILFFTNDSRAQVYVMFWRDHAVRIIAYCELKIKADVIITL